jgi:hypothetical protein
MNPSSLGIDIWLRRAKGSAVQRHKDMYKSFRSILFNDEGCSYRIIFLRYSRAHYVRFAEHIWKYYFCEATGLL